MSELSRSAVDKLGERLVRSVSDDDLRLLDDYRQQFREPYRSVVSTCTNGLRLQVTGRPSKSTISIIEKLKRESVRLSQIQDIAGCRIVVETADRQDRVVEALKVFLERYKIVDRNATPSHGYRAVHVVAFVDSYPVEIQVRTAFQHQWAELSEKFSDVRGAELKYGLGDPGLRALLQLLSDEIRDHEAAERVRAAVLRAIGGVSLRVDRKLKRRLREAERGYKASGKTIARVLDNIRNLSLE